MYALQMGLSTATHTTLLARLGSGQDQAAWIEFVARYGELIRGFCLRRGLQPADCEDVQQEVLMSLSKSMPGFQYDPSKGLFRSYLKTVVVHAILKKTRQNTPHHSLPDSESSPDAPDEQQWEQEWRQYHLRLAMRTIDAEFNPNDRRAFALYALDGKDVAAVARELEVSQDVVYQAKSRVLKRLSQLIDQQVREEG